MNKPTNVDFLIATDSEMKKVNWTSRKELIGSTKIVILFMFFIALFLFLYDLFFQLIFYLSGRAENAAVFLGQALKASVQRICNFSSCRVASNKEDRVREALARKVKIEGLEAQVGRILVPVETRPPDEGRQTPRHRSQALSRLCLHRAGTGQERDDPRKSLVHDQGNRRRRRFHRLQRQAHRR